MKFYLRILQAGLMGLPAADCLRHGDLWFCVSFAAGAAFVLAANRLFGETAAPETVDETRFRSGGAGPTTGNAERMHAHQLRYGGRSTSQVAAGILR
jgi:hypothetical protein